MKKRIFKSIFTATTIVFISSIILIIGVLYFHYDKEAVNSLKEDTEIYVEMTENSGSEYLEVMENDDDTEVVWLEESGKIRYDSMSGLKNRKDYRNKPEVVKAFDKGYGYHNSPSENHGEIEIACAVKLNDGSVIRTARGQPSFASVLVNLMKPILLILIFAIILSFALASNLSKKILQLVNGIDVSNPEQTEVYEEVRPLVEKISAQKEEYNDKIDKLQIDIYEKTREANFRKEFTANVSHELKTPLTSISGFAEIIKNGIAKQEDIPRFAGKIYDEAQRLIRVVGDILKLAQLDEMNVGTEKQLIDLYEVCEEVTELLEPVAEKEKVSLKLTGEHFDIHAVDQILGEMIYNLCDNAIKYNREGGSVRVLVHLENGRPAVSVKDNGIGIPQQDLERVFERFYRVNKSHSKEIGGTGLGLSIVKHGAEYHNAEIKIESELNVGTTITIVF